MEKIKQVFVDGDIINLKKGSLGYRVVYPIRNPDGKINWINLLFGGKANAIRIIFYIIIIVLLYFGINELISQYKLIAANPCDFCSSCFQKSLPYGKVLGSLT